MHVRTISTFILTALLATITLAEDWPQFRGPTGDGISTGKGFATTWGPDENIKWKTPLPSEGNGSPIVSSGRVFLAAATDDRRKRHLTCFDRADGKELWVRTVEYDKVLKAHKTNSFGGSTPAADGKHAVVWHSSAGLFCYDFAGKELWSRELGEFEHIWGQGSSPIIYGDKVVLHSGPGAKMFVAAFELDSGKTLWETPEANDGEGSTRADGKWMGSWSTPLIVKVNGQDQIVCTMPTRVNGYDTESGDIIWTCDGIRGPKGDLAYSSPIIVGDLCFYTGGYGGPSIAFKLGGSGNITESNRLWRKERNPQSIGSGVAVGKHVFRPNAGPGTIQCLVAQTGEEEWQNRAAGANHWGSMVLADGHLYVTNQNGTTVVLKPNTEEYEEVAQNQLGEDSNSTPAFSDGEIFLRTFQHLYCIGD